MLLPCRGLHFHINNTLGKSVSIAAENCDLHVAMRFFKLFLAFCTLLWTSNATNDGLTDVVSWDPYSLSINGDRVFILYVYGEFFDSS